MSGDILTFISCNFSEDWTLTRHSFITYQSDKQRAPREWICVIQSQSRYDVSVLVLKRIGGLSNGLLNVVCGHWNTRQSHIISNYRVVVATARSQFSVFQTLAK